MARLELRNRSSRTSLLSEEGPVVSMTTYGERAKTVYFAIESIGRGTVLPSRLILWLDERDFFEYLPKQLRRLQARGLEVRLCENLGPHKKYYPYVASQERFDTPLVTADDDILYPPGWLQGLVDGIRQYPGTVHCYRARVMALDDRGIAPYREWAMCTSTVASVRNVPTGCSGVIYPPEFLYALKEAGISFRDCCPRADDLWLHVQAIRAGYKIRQISETALHFPMLPRTQHNALYLQNAIEDDGNDQQIQATYTEADLALISECSSTPISGSSGQ